MQFKKKLIDIKESISDWFSNIRYNIRSFKRSIHNLKVWFPIVWKDRDYDHSFIYDLLHFKIEKQAAYLQKNNRFVGTNRKVEKMLLLTRLIEIHREDLYGLEYLDYCDLDFEFEPVPDRPGLSFLNLKCTNDNLDEYFKKYPRQHQRVLKEYPHIKSDRSGIANRIGDLNQERCRQLIHRILNENLETWWD